jgi:hypothetical protein
VKVGIAVSCRQCGRQKAPRGRSTPLGMMLCESDCSGYRADPMPGDLWPGETEEDFGYPIGGNATKDVP